MYCTKKEVLSLLKEGMQDIIAGEEYIEDEMVREEKISEYCEEAIQDACAEIDGYLAKRYRVPLAAPPRVITKYAKDIAVYNLVSRAGIDESDREKTYLNRYNAAVSWLDKVAKGIASLGIADDSENRQSADGFRMHSAERIFSRESMRGM